MSHAKLLYKIKNYSIKGHLFDWVQSFLSNRFQRVSVDGQYSNFTQVLSGVPQGSVLGPLLFLLYINDLPNVVPNSVNLKIFADDVKLYSSPQDSNALENIQAALLNISAWSFENQLKIAPDKSVLIPLHPHSGCTATCRINGFEIHSTTSTKDLGILIDSNLRFTDHCHYIASQAYQQINILFRCFTTANFKSLLKGYTSFARPLIEYASPVWNPFLKSDIILLERVQKYFTRRLYIRCSFPQASYFNRLQFLQLTTLEERRIKADLILYFKIINGFSVLKSSQFFRLYTNTSTRGHNKKLYTWLYSTDIAKNFFSNRFSTINVWNGLHPEVINARSCREFSNKLSKVDFTQFIHFDSYK